MDLHEYQNRLRQLATTASQRIAEAAVVPAGMRMLATIKNRIAQKGEATDGAEIGQYSTTPGYYSKEQFVKKGAFKPKGKAGSGRNPSPRKTMYLEQGYRELRSIQGRRVDKININYTGDLLASYQYQKTAQALLLGLNNASQVPKREGLEKRFGAIFYAQREELDVYNKEVTAAINDNTLRTLSRGGL